METREIRESELDDLLNLYSHMLAADDPMPERYVVTNVWNEIMGNPNVMCLGTFVNRKIVSSCTLVVVPNLTRACRPYGVIENVVTHIEFRCRGYAGNILKFALKRAWQKKCYKVMLLTGRKSEEVYRLYESVGFDRYAKQAFLAKPDIK